MDRVTEPGCGSATTGRKAMAFNLATTCKYATGARVQGWFEAPTWSVGPHATLRFRHWSETEAYSGYDVRRLALRVYKCGGSFVQEVQLASWSGPDTGAPDHWVAEVFDLSPYYGSQGLCMRARFSFDSVDGLYNDYAGWFVDDVEVL